MPTLFLSTMFEVGEECLAPMLRMMIKYEQKVTLLTN